MPVVTTTRAISRIRYASLKLITHFKTRRKAIRK